MTLLRVCGLSFHYKKRRILSDMDFTLKKGEVLGIVGANGAGKTTLLRCISGILKPRKGTVTLEDRDVFTMKRQELAKRIGYVPQSAPHQFPVTVFETVLMGRRPYISWRPAQKDLKIVSDLISSMDLEDMALRRFDQLSGGQKQKVLLARSFAQETDCLLLDEPTSNLDLRHQMGVMEMVASMARKRGTPAILAMHDLNLTAQFADTLLMLDRGRIFSKGSPREIMTKENIAAVYGVETEIKTNNGRPFIIPVRASGDEDALISGVGGRRKE